MFCFHAYDHTGKRVQGCIQARTLTSAISRLRRMYFTEIIAWKPDKLAYCWGREREDAATE
jgi:hypothetical protein